MSQTLIALYDHYSDAEAVVRELEAAEVPHGDISVVASNIGDRYATRTKERSEAGTGAAAGATLGAVVGGAGGVLAGLGILAIPGAGPVVAAGWLIAAATGAAGGAVIGGAGGGLIGSLVSSGIPKEDAQIYAEGVRRGGTIVTVRVSERIAPRVQSILQSQRRVDPAARGRLYRAAGWTGFDENAPPYIPD